MRSTHIWFRLVFAERSELDRIDVRNMNIPVIFRNLRGYDNHFIMQEIGQIVKKNYTVEKQMKLNVIPNNMEKICGFHA